MEKDASIESRRLAKEAVCKKAAESLADLIVVGHDFLNETERELLYFIRAMIERRQHNDQRLRPHLPRHA